VDYENRKMTCVLAAMAASGTAVTEITSCDSKSGDVEQGITAVTAEAPLKENSLSERFEASFQMVMDSTNSWGTYLDALGNLEDKVFQLPHAEALQVMENFRTLEFASRTGLCKQYKVGLTNFVLFVALDLGAGVLL